MTGLKIVVIGSGGFLGRKLCSKLSKFNLLSVNKSSSFEIKRLCFFDQNKPNDLRIFKNDSRISFKQGDLTSERTIMEILDPENCSKVICIHLAALLSGYSEENFDLGMKINTWGTLNVMERMRNLTNFLSKPQVYVFTSTDYVACFNKNNRNKPTSEESFRLSPVSYGIQKATNELFICDYTRKGFLDGRIGRISAIIGRPGWSNSISYPYTGIFTQPLEGKNYDVSLPLNSPYPCSSLNNNVNSIICLTKVFGKDLGHNRVVQLPAQSWTLDNIWTATKLVAKELKISLGKVRYVDSSKGNTTVKQINVCPHVDCSRAKKLGLPFELDLKTIIRNYCKNYIIKKKYD